MCVFQQFFERGNGGEQVGVAEKQEVFSSARHGYVQFSINQCAILLKHGVGEEVQLVVLLDGETVEDIVALTSLVAFHGVDSDVVQCRDAVTVKELLEYTQARGAYFKPLADLSDYKNIYSI